MVMELSLYDKKCFEAKCLRWMRFQLVTHSLSQSVKGVTILTFMLMTQENVLDRNKLKTYVCVREREREREREWKELL